MIYAPLAHAQETVTAEMRRAFSDIPYRASDHGIDYHALADFPVDHMLSHGEAEFMANTLEVFGDESAQIWARDMAREIGTGRISEFTANDMKEFTPNMLLSFTRIDPSDERYMLLREFGKNFELDQHLKASPNLTNGE